MKAIIIISLIVLAAAMAFRYKMSRVKTINKELDELKTKGSSSFLTDKLYKRNIMRFTYAEKVVLAMRKEKKKININYNSNAINIASVAAGMGGGYVDLDPEVDPDYFDSDEFLYGFDDDDGYISDADPYDDDYNDFINAEIMWHGGDIFDFEDRADAIFGNFDDIGGDDDY